MKVSGMIVLLATSAGAHGQTTDPATQPQLTPEEQAEIERATSADAKTLAEQPPSGQDSQASKARALQSLNPDISFVTDVALAGFTSDEPLQSGGHDPQENGFNLQQVEMAVAKSVDPYFRFDSFIVFGQLGVEVEEAYATTLQMPWNLQLRIGQFLTKFGRINPTHPHSWDFVDQPFAIGRIFGGEGGRGLGLEGSYLAPLPWFVEIVGSMTNTAGEETGESSFGGADLETPLDFQSTLAIKQFFELSNNWSLLWGLSLAGTGHANRTDVYGTDVYLKYRPITFGSTMIVSLQSEWIYRRRQIPEAIVHDLTGYVQLFWRFAKRWGTAARYEYGSPEWNLDGERKTAYEIDPFWTDHRHRVSGALTFWPTEFSRVRIQGSVDAPGWLADPIWAGFLAFEVSVGAHGGHAF